MEHQVIDFKEESNGLLHAKRSEPSENGILFTQEQYLLQLLNNEVPSKIEFERAINNQVYDISGELHFQALPEDRGFHYSDDNYVALLCARLLVSRSIEDFPQFFWNQDISPNFTERMKNSGLQPRSITFISMIKGGFLNILLLPLTSLIYFFVVMVSALSSSTDNSGNNLHWSRLMTLQVLGPWYLEAYARFTLWFREKVIFPIRENSTLNQFKDYFKFSDGMEHPNLTLARKIYE